MSRSDAASLTVTAAATGTKTGHKSLTNQRLRLSRVQNGLDDTFAGDRLAGTPEAILSGFKSGSRGEFAIVRSEGTTWWFGAVAPGCRDGILTRDFSEGAGRSGSSGCARSRGCSEPGKQSQQHRPHSTNQKTNRSGRAR